MRSRERVIPPLGQSQTPKEMRSGWARLPYTLEIISDLAIV